MPILPPAATPPYPTAEYVLKLVRSLCLDAGISIDGDLLADSANSTFVLLNAAYQYVQDEVANRGYETPTKETILSNVTGVPVSVLDPATQVYIGYDFYFDGLNNNAAPLLPQDVLTPIKLWERPHGSTVMFRPMYPAVDGLVSRPQSVYLVNWEWRDDKLYMVGATQAIDIRVRYQAYFPELANGASVIKIFHGANAIAYDTAVKFSGPRAGEAATYFAGERDAAIKQIVMRTAHKNQRKNVRRQPYGIMGCRGDY